MDSSNEACVGASIDARCVLTSFHKSIAFTTFSLHRAITNNTNSMFAKTNSNAEGLFSDVSNDNQRLPKGPVFYDSEDKLTVLFQMHGSVWPRVSLESKYFRCVMMEAHLFLWYAASHIPFLFFLIPLTQIIIHAIINTLLVVLLKILELNYGLRVTVSTLGHTIAGMVVSFLLVSRINSGLTRYNESRGYIGVMYRETREIVQKALVYSRSKRNSDRAGQEWRSELAYRAMLLLQTTVANISYPSRRIPAYEIPELSGVELQCATPDKEFLRHANIPSSEETDSVRVPKRMAQLVRETVCSQGDRLLHPITAQQEMSLLAAVDKFQGGNSGMRKFMVSACRNCVGMNVMIVAELTHYRPLQCPFPWSKWPTPLS
jgi:hypothetical protein